MQILILDDKNIYAKYFIKKNINQQIYIDILTEQMGSDNNKNINYIIGSRRRNKDLSSLDNHYDVIIDTDAIIDQDVELIYQYIDCDLYIYFSTQQVYKFQENKVFCEEDINDVYRNYVKNRYVDINTHPDEFYIKERINCEEKLLNIYSNSKTKYVIMRLGKLYSEQDIYQDLAWILSHLKNNIPFLIKTEDIMKCGYMNPIYINDLVDIIFNLILNKELSSQVYNICQDEFYSLFDYIYMSEQCIDIKQEIIVLKGKIIDESGYSYRVPINTNLIMSNNKIKSDYKINFTDTNEWITNIIWSLENRLNDSIVVSQQEKNIARYFSKQINRVNTFKVL